MSENHPVAHPLPEGVYNNFTYACNTCGGTVTVISSTRQPHTCPSTERDELTRIIMSPESFDGGPASCGPNDVYAARTADAILAAGYRKPQQVLTIGNLAAFADGTVIHTADGRTMELIRGRWMAPDSKVWWSPLVDWLPATVLHVGGAE